MTWQYCDLTLDIGLTNGSTGGDMSWGTHVLSGEKSFACPQAVSPYYQKVSYPHFFFFLQVIYFQNSQCKHSTLNSEAKLSKIIINRGQSSSTSIKMDFRIVFIFFGVVKSMTRLSNWIKTKQKGHFYTVNSREFEIFYRSSYLNFQVPFSPISTLTLVLSYLRI